MVVQYLFYIKSDNMVLERMMEEPLNLTQVTDKINKITSDRNIHYTVISTQHSHEAYRFVKIL